MKSQRNIAQLPGLILTLVGLMYWNTLPVDLSERAVQAATQARTTELAGPLVSRAVANGRIAFVSSTSGASSDIYTMNPDGSDRKQVTFSQDYEDQPAWSPDGTKIAFESLHLTGNGGYSEIFVMNADGSDQRRLTQTKYDRTLTWSPDGTKIAFWRIDSITTPSSWGIFVMNADGSDQQAVASTSNSSLQQPAWSPDGLKLAVTDIYAIYLINTDGSNPTLITQPPASFVDLDPAWSPDGSKITFIRCADSNDWGCYTTSHLWGVNADGSNPTKLTDTTASSHAWSPDGTKIIFGSANDSLEPTDLFVMNPDGSGLTNITNTDDTREWSPSWQPVSLPPALNPTDDAQFFVRQQYRDFLNREPDAGGLAYWTNEITRCGSDARCIHDRRIGVSGAFFAEPEFQETGYFVDRLYQASFGQHPSFAQFNADRALLTVGPNLEASKQALAANWVERTTFKDTYPITLSPEEFVNKLFDTANLKPYTGERQQLATDMRNGKSRAQVLREVIEIAELETRQYNPAFVLMQYFGYLRRNVDQGGYDFWLDVLNNREPNNYRGMICSFITSREYQERFGSAVTRSNADCGR